MHDETLAMRAHALSARPADPGLRLRLAWVVACAAALAGCAPMHTAPAPAAAVSAAPGNEPAFMSHIAANHLYEIEVSRLAEARATSPRVRSLARTLASHRAHARQQLALLMRAHGMVVPVRLAPDKASKLHRLEALRPSPDFDAAYVRVVGLEDHEQGIALLERARRETRDPALIAWIDRTLPVMRRDLQAAQQVAARSAG
jgi:putative membrane protein